MQPSIQSLSPSVNAPGDFVQDTLPVFVRCSRPYVPVLQHDFSYACDTVSSIIALCIVVSDELSYAYIYIYACLRNNYTHMYKYIYIYIYIYIYVCRVLTIGVSLISVA